MLLKNGLEYRKRRLKSKVIFEVRIDGKWKSTGETTLEGAVIWSYEYSPKKVKRILFKVFAKNFYHRDSFTMRRKELRGKSKSEGWYIQSQARLEKYILPYWGRFYIHEITSKLVDEWVISLDYKKSKKLSPATKNKILTCMRTVMQEAKVQTLIDLNPVKDVESFSECSKERKIFTQEELAVLFPEDKEHLLSIWENLVWACYFMVLRDTGHRMGEQAVLTWSDLYAEEEKYGFIIDKSMDWYTRKTKPSTKTGYNRATRISDESYQLLMELKKVHPHKMIFTLDGESGIISETARKHLKLAAKRAGIDLAGRTPYCFRHTVNTNLLLRTNPDTVRFLMGHKTLKETTNYNHPDSQLLLKRASKIEL